MHAAKILTIISKALQQMLGPATNFFMLTMARYIRPVSPNTIYLFYMGPIITRPILRYRRFYVLLVKTPYLNPYCVWTYWNNYCSHVHQIYQSCGIYTYVCICRMTISGLFDPLVGSQTLAWTLPLELPLVFNIHTSSLFAYGKGCLIGVLPFPSFLQLVRDLSPTI
jgi:hypothetical protein